MIDTVRNFAIDWQDFASNADYSYNELAQVAEAIETLARIADPSGELIEELKENGVL